MPFQALEENLSKLEMVPPLTQSARNLATDLPAIRAYVRNQIQEQDNSAIQVDFIWNMHPSVYDQEKQLRQLRSGQEGVITCLTQNNYELIGLEGQSHSLFNYSGYLQNLRADCEKAAQEMGRPFEEHVYQTILTEKTNEFGPIRYLSLNPHQRAFGIERHHLHRMHDSLLAFLRFNKVQGDFWGHFNYALLNARSTVALAKALDIARTQKISRVVVVSGVAHQKGVQMLKQTYGIQGVDQLAPGTPTEVR